MAIKVGDKIPEAALQVAGPGGIEKANTSELFAGKKTVLFAVPGAFTPTCSAKHLPGFIDRADEIRSKGVDQIVCLSVNDAFVMDAWAKDGWSVASELMRTRFSSSQRQSEVLKIQSLNGPSSMKDSVTVVTFLDSTFTTRPAA